MNIRSKKLWAGTLATSADRARVSRFSPPRPHLQGSDRPRRKIKMVFDPGKRGLPPSSATTPSPRART